jgi:hypothetical protein
MTRKALVVLLFAILPMAFYGDPMNDQENPASGQSDRNQPALPLELGSPALILSASHLFVIEVVKMSATPWAAGGDGLEHRSLHLDLRLVENLKGVLARNGDAVSVDLPQRRESALMVSDYHGFWSHTDVEKGASYLVAADGGGGGLQELLREPSIQALYPAALAADVRLAITAERQFGSTLRSAAGGGDRLTAARGLLKFTHERRTAVHELFSQYMWVRISPVYRVAEESIEPAVLEMIETSDSAIPLREALVYGAYDEVLSLGPTPPRSGRLLRALLELLLQPQASAMFDRMLQAPIYNLAFQPGRPPLPAGDVITSAADRNRMAAVAAGLPSARAKAVAAWLAGE